MSPEEWCAKNPDAIEYYEEPKYRRLPLTTCQGGVEFDKQSMSHPCPGKEREFERLHAGPSWAVLVFAVILPVTAAAGTGFWVWRNWSAKFGQIRLGEPGGGIGALASDRPWVRYPVIALSAMFAVVGAIPLVASGLWRTAKGAAESWGWADTSRGAWSQLGAGRGGGGARPFTTRDSFARATGDYAVGDEDEGELLGDESEDEV